MANQIICNYCDEAIVGIHECDAYYENSYGIHDPYRKEHLSDVAIFVEEGQNFMSIPKGYAPKTIIYTKDEFDSFVQAYESERVARYPEGKYNPFEPAPFQQDMLDYIESLKKDPAFKRYFTTKESYYESLPKARFTDGGFSLSMYYGNGLYPWNGLKVNWTQDEYLHVIDLLVRFLDLLKSTDKKDKEYYLSVLFHKESGNLVVYRDGVKIFKLEV